jgi:outer membrane protein OmpA-like peptidoglycan-associated protein
MCRSRSEAGPVPGPTRLIVAGIVASAAHALAAAEASGQPSPADVRRASLPAGSVGFPGGSVDFPDGSLSTSDGRVGFPTGTVSLSTGTIAGPAERSGGELRFRLTADLLFDFDKADLRPEAEGVLRDILAQIKARAKQPILRIEGHTDAKGADRYNQDLSERRAASVKAWFVRSAKLPTKSITTTGFGEGRPVAPNEKPDGSDDPEGRQTNRRVEIVATSRS